MSDIKVLEQKAMEIRRRYDQLEKTRNKEPWDAMKLADGLKKDVNQLIEVLNARSMNQKKLDHELADCLWSVLVIARKVGVDIERVFWATMAELDRRLDSELK